MCMAIRRWRLRRGHTRRYGMKTPEEVLCRAHGLRVTRVLLKTFNRRHRRADGSCGFDYDVFLDKLPIYYKCSPRRDDVQGFRVFVSVVMAIKFAGVGEDDFIRDFLRNEICRQFFGINVSWYLQKAECMALSKMVRKNIS